MVAKMKKNEENSKTVIVTNTKGGAAKSTTTMQVCAPYFLDKGQSVTLYEFDDENKDSASFTETVIETVQVQLGDYSDLNNQLRDLFLDNKGNKVIDVGGNRTTTEFLSALKRSRMFRKVDLFVIPISSGSQDVKNAVATFEAIKEFEVPVVFCLSRSRHSAKSNRVNFQYSNFFKEFPEHEYFILKDSDSIDLSRILKKTVYELANDIDSKLEIENTIDEAFEKDDNDSIKECSLLLEILDESALFTEENIKPAFSIIEKHLEK